MSKTFLLSSLGNLLYKLILQNSLVTSHVDIDEHLNTKTLNQREAKINYEIYGLYDLCLLIGVYL